MSLRFLRPLALAAAAALSAGFPAFAQNNVSLRDLSIRGADQKSTLTIARVEVSNTNLTPDEVARLFSAESAGAERLALAGRMTADRVVVSGAMLTGDEAKISLGDFQASGVDKGRFRTATLAGFSATFTDERKGAGGTLTARPIELQEGNLAPLIAAAEADDLQSAAFQVGRISWAGFDAAFTDPDVSAAAAGGNQIKISLKSLTASTDYKGDTPLRSEGEAVGLVVEPAPASEFGKGLRAFGYERLEFGFSGAGRYDPAARTLQVEDYTLTGAGAGRLSLAAELSGVDATALMAADSDARALALLGASASRLKIAFTNEGLVEKSFAYAAAQQGKTAGALQSETSKMAGQILPLLLGGDPSSLALAQSAQAFLAKPRNFTLTLKARGAPLPLAQLAAIRDPSTFLALVEVQLEANR